MQLVTANKYIHQSLNLPNHVMLLCFILDKYKQETLFCCCSELSHIQRLTVSHRIYFTSLIEPLLFISLLSNYHPSRFSFLSLSLSFHIFTQANTQTNTRNAQNVQRHTHPNYNFPNAHAYTNTHTLTHTHTYACECMLLVARRQKMLFRTSVIVLIDKL